VKVEELTEGVVSRSDSLGAFFSSNADSDMRFHNHRNVIRTVTDGESDPFPVFLCKTNNVGLLLGRNAAAHYR
jgi:hypothetical protein